MAEFTGAGPASGTIPLRHSEVAAPGCGPSRHRARARPARAKLFPAALEICGSDLHCFRHASWRGQSVALASTAAKNAPIVAKTFYRACRAAFPTLFDAVPEQCVTLPQGVSFAAAALADTRTIIGFSCAMQHRNPTPIARAQLPLHDDHQRRTRRIWLMLNAMTSARLITMP